MLCFPNQEAESSLVSQMVKESACNAGDQGLIPGSGRSPGEGNGDPLQYSCLESPMGGGAWWGPGQWGWKESLDTTDRLTHTLPTRGSQRKKCESFWGAERGPKALWCRPCWSLSSFVLAERWWTRPSHFLSPSLRSVCLSNKGPSGDPSLPDHVKYVTLGQKARYLIWC